MITTQATSHIQRVRQAYEANRDKILSIGSVDENWYNDTWIDAGFIFLKELYPPNEQQFEAMFTQVSKDPFFWKWWVSEWKRSESDYLNKYTPTIMGYLGYMIDEINDAVFETGFYENYLTSKTVNFFNNK